MAAFVAHFASSVGRPACRDNDAAQREGSEQ